MILNFGTYISAIQDYPSKTCSHIIHYSVCMCMMKFHHRVDGMILFLGPVARWQAKFDL